MGCTPSSIAKERVATATINDLLQDDRVSSKVACKFFGTNGNQIIQKLSPYSGSLSAKAKSNLSYLTHRQEEYTINPELSGIPAQFPFILKHKDLRTFMRLREPDTDLPPSIQGALDGWRDHPSTFFDGLDRRETESPDEYLTVATILERLHIVEKAGRSMANETGTAILEELLRPVSRKESFLSEPPRINRQSEQVFYRQPVLTDYDSSIFICVQDGDIDGMRRLLSSSLASIDAIDPYNLGLLYYATYYCWRSRGKDIAMATCKALVDAGANIEWPDEIGSVPAGTMIDILIVESAMMGEPFGQALSELGQIFGRSPDELWLEYNDTRGLTDVHKALLMIDNTMPLEEYLCIEGNTTVDARDSLGRTALDWAVEHGWVAAVKTLIRYGANVNQARENSGLSLLHIAVAGPAHGYWSDVFSEILQLLLDNGADANTRDGENWTASDIAESWKSWGDVMTLTLYAE
ncbi:Palmitoyltransferase AKR1 [Cytospora mali]|uniref:Palmitoyltransferase AKR1 n=1 Tax=Cytospora mali TaxID=578113 RepID=A0A194VKL1_CYTMA|nr:Palmitoyltransferase AKR1 [Valsa mali]